MEDNEETVIEWFRALNQAMIGSQAQRSICDCLTLAAQSISDPECQPRLEALTVVVGQGISVSKAMELFPTLFSPKHVAVVRYGEMYGELDLTLERYVERPEDRASRCYIPVVQPD